VCHRALQFRESAQNGGAPAVLLERARATTPPTLYAAWDQKVIGILIGATLISGPQPGGTSPAIGWSIIAVKPSGRGGRQDATTARHQAKIHQNGCQNVIFYGMSEVEKDLEELSAGIVFFFKSNA
jgi:hypothetical protein